MRSSHMDLDKNEGLEMRDNPMPKPRGTSLGPDLSLSSGEGEKPRARTNGSFHLAAAAPRGVCRKGYNCQQMCPCCTNDTGHCCCVYRVKQKFKRWNERYRRRRGRGAAASCAAFGSRPCCLAAPAPADVADDLALPSTTVPAAATAPTDADAAEVDWASTTQVSPSELVVAA